MKGKQNLQRAIDTLYTRAQASTEETYTRLVLECFRVNDVDQAKRIQTHMDSHSHQPKDTFIQNRLLHLYAKSGKLSDARNLFDKMPRRDIISWNALLSAYSKTGSVKDLKGLFDQMPHRDSVSYNTLIRGLASNGLHSDAMEVFVKMQREGFEVTDYTIVIVLSLCSQLSNLKCGKQIHGRVVVDGKGGNTILYNALIDMYVKCGELYQGMWLFDHMDNKSIVSWNLMISGHLKGGQSMKCINLFRKMKASGLKSDDVTLSNVIRAYFDNGFIDKASNTFNSISEKDLILWTTMIVGYAQNGKEEEALVLFGKMLKQVKPDTFTLSSVISCCAKLASLCHGQVIHGKAFNLGFHNDLLVSSALINMYCKSGAIGDAWSIFSMMPTRNLVSWNSMICGYAQNGEDSKALSLYEQMLENVKPDAITFVGVLSACVHSGLVEEGQRYFDSISEIHKMTPTSDHYACMINLFGRSRKTAKILDLIKNMPHEPNSLVWSSLLSVSSSKGDLEHAEKAAKHLFRLEPSNAIPYIMLSNMYASCGKWDDVARIRSLMKENNVRKSAAYSWIEIDNTVHRFVSDDRTHPETKLIYEELDRLVKKFQEAGFSPDTKLVLHDVNEDEKFKSICYHSEKLALAFGLIKKPLGGTPIRIMKNIRTCGDCHRFMKETANDLDLACFTSSKETGKLRNMFLCHSDTAHINNLLPRNRISGLNKLFSSYSEKDGASHENKQPGEKGA
ncbi:hypothetical protein ACFE04_019030 [Oxalis oulophora]